MRERLADRPPRPLADAPVESLLASANELARDWLIEVVAQIELEDVPSLEVGPLVTDGPELYRAMTAALAADSALAALRRGGRMELLLRRVLMAAARGRSDEVPSVAESLRRVLLSAALARADPRPSADLVAALSDRVAHVCAVIAATAIATPTETTSSPDAASIADAARMPEAGKLPSDGTSIPSDVDVIPRTGDEAESLEFVVRDERPRSAIAAPRDWSDELRDALAGSAGRSLLLVDLDGHERILAADGRGALQRAERALIRALVDDATLVAERLGRYWIVCGQSSLEDARAFARQLGEAVAAEPGHLGTALQASIGFTLLEPGSGEEDSLARVEEAMLSARAAGAGVDSR